ncbi:ABC transporter permease [Phytoactinopolyspora endophytica]|uniref:ABC transporter permease n=1 Tax=Phytoactinopolyspora endophytica TaxID=1642495 RepID=UPI00101C17E2|nr:ABC transporter permease subunit [Phytoactinopolyspora endophytica]
MSRTASGLTAAIRSSLLGLVGVAGLTAVWAGAVAGGLIDGVPSPAEVFPALTDQLQASELWRATGHTLGMTAAATAIATVVAVLLGTAVGMSAAMDRLLGSTINTLRFVPPVALIPVVLLLMGFGPGSEIAVGAFAALWPVLLNVASATSDLRHRFEDMTKIERLNPVRKLVTVYVPGALPATITGVRLAAALALILVVAIEMLAVPQGLGHQLRFAGDALQLPTMYAYILWTGVVGLLLNTVLLAGERRLRWT